MKVTIDIYFPEEVGVVQGAMREILALRSRALPEAPAAALALPVEVQIDDEETTKSLAERFIAQLGVDGIKEVLTKLGVARVRDVPESSIPEFRAMLRAGLV